MTVVLLRSIGAITLLLTLSVFPARAITLDEFIELTGELTIAAWGACKIELNPEAHRNISAPFIQRDPKKHEEVEKRIENAIETADKRRARMGNQAFCNEIIAKYHPEGTRHKGLAK